jgi:hypothetical protein
MFLSLKLVIFDESHTKSALINISQTESALRLKNPTLLRVGFQIRVDLESDLESDFRGRLRQSAPKDFKVPITRNSFFQLVEFALIPITC